MSASVEKRLEKLQQVFRKPGAWIQDAEALDAFDRDVDPTTTEAVAFCLLGGAKHVGDGKKMLLVLAQAIDPSFDLKDWHADWHGLRLAEFKSSRDCDGDCGFDANQSIEDIITEYNDKITRRVQDIRLILRKAKKLAAEN